MRQKHKDILEEFGVEILHGIPRSDGKGDKAYAIRYEGKEYVWATSSIDRRIPPWKFSKKRPKVYKYGDDFYIYRMFDADNNLLYIGKTKQLDYRMYAHFYKYRDWWKDQVKYIDGCKFDNEANMHIYEMYLITKLKPTYNRHASCDVEPSLVLPELSYEEVTDWE